MIDGVLYSKLRRLYNTAWFNKLCNAGFFLAILRFCGSEMHYVFPALITLQLLCTV
jgi:hypothetical protein